MKIVVAVDADKKTIVKKTGQAVYYAVYEDTKPIDFIENNQNESHGKNVLKFAGCDVILVQAIGEHMRESIESVGLEIKKIRKKDGVTADEAVKNFLNNNI